MLLLLMLLVIEPADIDFDWPTGPSVHEEELKKRLGDRPPGPEIQPDSGEHDIPEEEAE